MKENRWGMVVDVPIVDTLEHYEKLIQKAMIIHDSKLAQEYISRWDGPEFYSALGSCINKGT